MVSWIRFSPTAQFQGVSLLFLSYLISLTTLNGYGESLTFEGKAAARWQRQDFNGANQMMTNGDELHVISHAAATAYYYEFEQPVSVPFTLSWDWKIEHVLNTGDPLRKANDDYAARVYAVFRYGPFFWQVRAINYVRSRRHTDGQGYWLSPYSGNAALIPLDGTVEPGRWRSHRVTPMQDYRRIFQAQPGPLLGIALMTDTDDTGQSVQAWYRAIKISFPTSAEDILPPFPAAEPARRP